MKELDNVFDGLSHPVRRKIIELIGGKGPQTYSQLLEETGLQTGTLNYHLGKLKELLVKDEDGRYSLSHLGALAYRTMEYASQNLYRDQTIIHRPSITLSIGSLTTEFYKLILKPSEAYNPLKQSKIVPLLIYASILFLSMNMGNKELIVSAASIPASYALIDVLSRMLYKAHGSSQTLLLFTLKSFYPQGFYAALKLLLSYYLARMDYRLYLLASELIVKIVQPIIALWIFVLLIIAVSNGKRIDRSKAFVVVIFTFLIIRTVFDQLGIDRSIIAITF